MKLHTSPEGKTHKVVNGRYVCNTALGVITKNKQGRHRRNCKNCFRSRKR